jgi:hypothetical protein
MRTVFFILALWPVFVFAGVTNGGGGKAVVCRDLNREIQSAKLLDLYEAELQYDLVVENSGGDFSLELSRVAKKIEFATSHNRVEAKISLSSLRQNYGHFKILPKGVGIQEIDDSMDVLIPEGCAVEQLAYFKEPKVILVNGDIWQHLDTINRVGLVVHETIYQLQRQHGARDSRESRKITGYLMSGLQLPRTATSIPEEGQIIGCETKDKANLFYLYEEPDRQDMISFVKFGGQPVFTEMTLRISSIGKYISGEVPLGASSAQVGGGLTSAMPHRVYDRGALLVEPTELVSEFVKASLILISIDGDFSSGNNQIQVSCFREDRQGTRVSRQSLR